MPKVSLTSHKKDLFKEILLENKKEESDLFSKSYLKREFQIPIIPKKATILTGIRRSGKSTLMLQILQEVKNATQGPFYSLHINFFDERLRQIAADDLNCLIEAFYEIYPELSGKEKLHLFLDEIEVIPNWELFIERQLRNPQRQVFITGSSSRLLSKEIATSMRGRSLSFEVFPFSFLEILEWENLSRSAIQIDRGRINGRFQKYLFEGGFPEVIPQRPLIQKKILTEYYEVLLLRDIIERNHESNIPLLRNFIRFLFQSFSSLITINKTHDRLKSIGIKTDKSKLTEILKWVEDCYLIFPVSIFTESVSKQLANPRKIYVIDNGLIKATTTQTSENTGRLLENAVFLFLRAQNKSIYYYKTRSGYEIDFIVDEKTLYQVAQNINDPETLNREIRALDEGMAELGVKESYLITQEEVQSQSFSNEIRTPTGTIIILLASRWMSSPRIYTD